MNNIIELVKKEGKRRLILLGKGSNGVAFSFNHFEIGKTYVVKFTNSVGEFICANNLMILQKENKQYIDYTSEIYETHIEEDLELDFNISGKSYNYIIITEYLNTNKELQNYFSKNVFGNIMKYCFENKITLTEVIENNKQHYFENEDCNRLLVCMKIEKELGGQDLHSGNVGYDSNGLLKAFDFDFKQAKI